MPKGWIDISSIRNDSSSRRTGFDVRRIARTYSGLPRSLYIICFARIVNTIGNFVHPFLTLLLTIKVGMGEQEVGKYLLLASILQIPGSLIGGRLSDAVGRKRISITFMALAALCLVPCAFLVDSPASIIYVPWFLILSTFFSSVFGPVNSAMVNDLTTPDNRKQAFSLLYMGVNAGTAIGSVVAGFLFNNFMKLLFIGDAITTFIAVAILARYVPETNPTHEDYCAIGDERCDERFEEGGLLRALARRPRLLVFTLLNTVFAFVYAQCHFSLPLQTRAVFGEAMGAQLFGTFNMINCVEVIVLTTFLAYLLRKIRPAFNVAIAGLFFAVGFGMLAIPGGFWLFALSTFIWTIGEIIHATNVGVYVANHTPISHRGRFSAVINIISGVGASISPLVMGTVIASRGVSSVWPLTFVLALGTAAAMLVLGSSERREPITAAADSAADFAAAADTDAISEAGENP